MADNRGNKFNCHKLNFLLIWLGNMNNDKLSSSVQCSAETLYIIDCIFFLWLYHFIFCLYNTT